MYSSMIGFYEVWQGKCKVAPVLKWVPCHEDISCTQPNTTPWGYLGEQGYGIAPKGGRYNRIYGSTNLTP